MLVVLLLMWVISAITAENSFSQQCISTNNCTCIPTPAFSHYEFHCPEDDDSVILTITPATQRITIDCMDEINWDVQDLPSIKLGRMKYVEIKQCPLPTNNFGAVIRKLGINSTNILTFINSEYVKNSILNFEMFEGVEHVQKLVIDSNNLHTINSNAFMYLSELLQLELRFNDISLPDGIFDHLTKLKSLDLTGNKLRYLPDGIFKNLSALEELSLRSNNITYVNNTLLKNLQNLNLLELSCNNVIDITEDSFDELENLKILSLSVNKLQYLPQNLFDNLKSLNKVYLFRNPGLTLSNGLFSNLLNLEDIELNECELISLPSNLFNGSINIKKINLRINKIQSIPKQIFHDLKQLENLDLGYNALKELPEQLFINNINLINLNLANNLLNRIKHRAFENLHKLERLDLENNQIIAIDNYVFGNMANLKFISLANNFIDLNNQVAALFSSNLQLEEINLSHNNITIITADLVQILSRLKKLDLSYNEIASLQFSDILTSSFPIRIDLSHNKIAVIDFANAIKENEDYEDEPGKYGKRIISLKDNPIKCNCQIYDFVMFMDLIKNSKIKNLISIELNDLKCVAPNKYLDIPVSNLQLEMLTCSVKESGIPINETSNCTSYEIRPWDKSLIIDCKNLDLTKPPHLILPFNDMYHQIEVHLEENQITNGPTKEMGYENVTKLYLSSNSLDEISWVPPHIEVLELHDNNISHIDGSLLSFLNSSSLVNITLGNNPWICDCTTTNLTNFLTSSSFGHKQIDVKNITCKETGKYVIRLKEEDLCPNNKLILFALGISVLLVFTGFCILYIVFATYRTEIKVWLFAHKILLWYVQEEELDKDKKYDAFISYSHKDEEFVLKQLQPVLESGLNSYKLCLHIRDWIAGEFISKQIIDSISNSRRTLVILSRNYLESEWGKMEFRIAHKQALQEGRARVILILYGEIDLNSDLDDELRAYIKTNTYVKWGDPWFWDKLRYALPHLQNNKVKESNLILALRKILCRLGDKIDLIQSRPTTPNPISTPPVLSLYPAILKKNPLDFTPTEV